MLEYYVSSVSSLAISALWHAEWSTQTMLMMASHSNQGALRKPVTPFARLAEI